MKSQRLLFYSSLLVAWALVSGCKKDEVTVYNIPKPLPESATPEMTGTDAMPGMGAQSGAAPGQPSLMTATVPPDWQPQPLTQMRQASYLVKGDNGASADISLVIFPGEAGGVLENVNRWLKQLGKPEVTDDQLAQTAEHVSAPFGDVIVVDIEGLPQGADAAKDGRILGSIATANNQSYFFKIRGNSALVESQKKAFVDWINSVGKLVITDTTGMNAGAPAPAPAPDKSQIKWDVPADWKTVPPSAMRYASFAAAGQNGEAADISVSVFDGDGGGNLENVNRWRGQAGLEPIAQDGLQALVVPVICKDGDILTVDMAGPKTRILAGWARTGGRTWFFKLTAPPKLAAAQKAAFAKFLQSIQFHP